jgi:NAD(P)-dependent dehydrogenase (short-subunit alcohol dehydrogenase family)
MTKVLVTGGTGALGSDVGRVLRDAGWEVHLSAANSESAATFAETPDNQMLAVHVGELSDGDDTKRLMDEVGAPLGALVVTVGGFLGGPIGSLLTDDLDRLLSLNLKTTVHSLREAYPLLKGHSTGASVVLVSARGAVTGGPGSALYSATKAAISNLALSLCQEWRDDAITVNAILPSTMDTPANRRDMPDADYSMWPTTREVAEVVAFLVSDKAQVVSGATIPVYGKA